MANQNTKVARTGYIILLLIILSSLLTTDFFYEPISTAYFGFSILSLLFLLFFYLFNFKRALLLVTTPNIIFGLWVIYVTVRFCFNGATTLFTIQMIVFFLLLNSTTILFSHINAKVNLFLYGIIVLATIESLYCIAQFFSILKSKNEHFPVTGSWNNPNVTAVFLTLTAAVFFHMLQNKRKIVYVCFGSLIFALITLKCRTAFIGLVFSAIIFYGLKYDFLNWFRDKKNKTASKALVILILIVFIPVVSSLYNYKKASADGRLFIWKVSLAMICEKPIIGYGYGYFEREYNLYQAEYLDKQKITSQEFNNSGPVIMPHNEFIQNIVEGGIVGFILYPTFFCTLLATIRYPKLNERQVKKVNSEAQTEKSIFYLAYAGISAFLIMSLFSSTFKIPPLMGLTILYAGMICSTLKPIDIPMFSKLFYKGKGSNVFSLLQKISMILLIIFLTCQLVFKADADLKNKYAYTIKKEQRYKEAIKIMATLKGRLQEDRNYWENYANIYYKTQNYSQAIICLNKAKEFSTLPDLYAGTAACYEKLNNYPKAIAEYKQLILLMPSKFFSRFKLMENYIKNKDTINALATGRSIMELKPKIPSIEVEKYKKATSFLLHKLEEGKTLYPAKNKFKVINLK